MATSNGPYEVDLSWTNNSSPSATFEVEQSTDGVNFTLLDTTAPGVASYQDQSVDSNTTYTYEIITLSGGNAESIAATATVTTDQASLSNLTAAATSSTEIGLTWTDNTDGVDAPQVWRMDNLTPWTLVATLSPGTQLYTDQDLSPNTSFGYYVSASGAPPLTSASSKVYATTLPSPVTGVTASLAGADTIVSWSASNEDIVGYHVLTSTDGTSYSYLGAVDANTTSLYDWRAPDGITDYYDVVAVGDGGNSFPSASASAMPIAQLTLTDDTPATDVTYQILHGKTLTIDAGAGILANDTDLNSSTIIVANHSSPSHGTLTLNNDGSFTYVANKSYVGVDSFTYTATDQFGASSNTATVQIEVTDDMPEATSP